MHLAALLKEDGDWGVVIGALVGALILAFIVDRAFSRRTAQLAEAVTRGHVSRETATRLMSSQTPGSGTSAPAPAAAAPTAVAPTANQGNVTAPTSAGGATATGQPQPMNR